ncbi:MAG: hypothetical protein M3O46_14320, partial [Myxococcota bacterium]|nr:hypothetical protein [Myxococcota bacterium]
MKRLLPFLLILGACAPDIAQNHSTTDAIVVGFDPGATPAVVPLPNDLALVTGKIVVPPSPNDTPA